MTLKQQTNTDYQFDAIVVGAGHAGTEAALALARLNCRTLCLSVTLDNAGYLACNPSIGGTAKGHLVREVDALGGEMGRAADTTLVQLRMLNSSKGPAVHSLRAQVDKYKYHSYIKKKLENEKNLFLRQGEAKNLIVEDGKICGVETVTGLKYYAKAVVLACGVYLKSTIIVGSVIEERGPVCFPRANYLSDSLLREGFVLRRFKTGTPARVNRDSVNLDELEVQYGEDTPYSFSALELKPKKKKSVCYLGYTNEQTHEVIRENLGKSLKYAGVLHGTGARYCPSLEDKVVRFADKERHQFFLEPEGEDTKEMYVQGLSTGLPADIQLRFYRTIKGFENLEIMRDAYAIEYECIDPQQLFPTLMSKRVSGLFFAGQINGTSGYEEAAAQGIVAGINAARFVQEKEPIILTRDSSYIGVLIDDLVTVGTNEPYRMMTSRAEFRLLLRQDNADLRLTPIGIEVGLVDEKRRKLFEKKKRNIKKAESFLSTVLPTDKVNEYLKNIGEASAKTAMTVEDVIKRGGVTQQSFCECFDVFDGISADAVNHVFIETRYRGYLERERRAAAEIKRMEDMPISENTDFSKIEGLRNEAKEKLAAIRPLTVGQASRISGVTPADVNVLIIRLKTLGRAGATNHA